MVDAVLRKVGTDDDKGFQCYLANVQYKLKDSEKTIREGFVKIGGIETTKEFIAKLDLKTGQKVLGGGCGIGGGDFYMPDNFGVMACKVRLKEIGHKESDCQDGGIAYGC
ncbi:hypothetical protein IFM89_032391 [Coptis chinensis]|uniref:phosphoethanolamine N-methyltransferase n=1 Tax=Coptis chinensis TaxID=261450 RepID=A0A835HXV6_9MAGN|nr:hypothetical protein IFM89_032391 [Coptis chinensis]